MQKLGLEIKQVFVTCLDCFERLHADTADFECEIAHPLRVVVHYSGPLFYVEEHQMVGSLKIGD